MANNESKGTEQNGPRHLSMFGKTFYLIVLIILLVATLMMGAIILAGLWKLLMFILFLSFGG